MGGAQPVTSAPWEIAGYSEIASAERNEAGGLRVTFENGETVEVPTGLRSQVPFDSVRVNVDDPLEVELLSGDEVVQRISWVQIRSATDAAFAQHMRELDAEESRRLGRRLKALREDKGVKQADLAAALSMSAPQLSKIEAGSHDMRVSTVRALLRALNATFADIAGTDVPEVSLRTTARRLASSGVDATAARELLNRVPRPSAQGFLERVFGWDRETLVTGSTSVTPLRVAVQFKAPRASQAEPSPLVHLANAIAEAGRAATPNPVSDVPADPETARAAIEAKRGQLTYRALLEYVWEQGIPVLPMSGKGGFVASAWQVEGGPAIVLKEPRDIPAFWIFDLAHELGHIACGHITTRSIIDVQEPTSDEALASDDEQEREANDYALTLLVPDFPARVAEVRKRSRGNYLAFKNAVASTARDYGLNAGVLGVIAAHELTDLGQHKDRWGSSINLSKLDGAGRAVAESAARHYLDLTRLPEDDLALLETVVLTEPN